MTDYTPTTEEALYCSSCWANLKLYPPATELVFERDFTVNTETVRKVYRYVRTDATEFDRWLAEVKAQTISDAIAYLKTTPAVTLTGKGGGYELLESYLMGEEQ